LIKKLLFLLAISVPVFAQTSYPTQATVSSSAPSGSCASNQFWWDTTSQALYFCPTGSWNLATGGGAVYPPGTGIPQVVSGSAWGSTLGVQGTDTNALTSGTVTGGAGQTLCTDLLSGATTAGCANNVGQPPASVSFTAQLTVTLTHNYGIKTVTIGCEDTSGTPIQVLPNSVSYPTINTATITFTTAQSGICWGISAIGPTGVTGATGATGSITNPIAAYNLIANQTGSSAAPVALPIASLFDGTTITCSSGVCSAVGASGANNALSNLSAVSINTSLLFQTATDVGSTAAPLRNLYLVGTGTYGTNYIELTGAPTSTRTITLPDATTTLAGLSVTQTFTGNITIAGSFQTDSTSVFSQTAVAATGTAAEIPFTVRNTNASPSGDLIQVKAGTSSTIVGHTDFAGNVYVPSINPQVLYSVAGTALPTCASGTNGRTAIVSDGTSPTFGGTYGSGGGTVTWPVVCSFNGSTYSWLFY
jgi:hypothetical protein